MQYYLTTKEAKNEVNALVTSRLDYMELTLVLHNVGESDLYWTSIYIGPRRFHSFTTIQQLVAPNRVLAAKQVIDWLIQSGGMRAPKKRCGFLYLSCCCCNCIAISSVCLSVSIDPASVGFACRVFEGLL